MNFKRFLVIDSDPSTYPLRSKENINNEVVEIQKSYIRICKLQEKVYNSRIIRSKHIFQSFTLLILTTNDESTMFCEKTNGVPNIKILTIGIFEIDIAGMSENQNFAWKYF